MSRPVITLTTDFGQADGYVGAMKGVILSICPEAALADISHEIRPQAVEQAAYVLSTAVAYYPPGTVHLVVVDPGVGSQRRPIAVRTERAAYVGPDNGVLGLALAQDPARQAVRLTEPSYRLSSVSATFHGRDIFAPAAAHLACGAPPDEMGETLPVSELVELPISAPEPQPGGGWRCAILLVDRFGNLITNFQVQPHQRGLQVGAGGQWIGQISRTFTDVDRGELLAYVGSSGYLEIAAREASAAEILSLGVGDTVQIEGAL
jgi:S-adenosylmethionine hydrolase